MAGTWLLSLPLSLSLPPSHKKKGHQHQFSITLNKTCNLLLFFEDTDKTCPPCHHYTSLQKFQFLAKMEIKPNLPKFLPLNSHTDDSMSSEKGYSSRYSLKRITRTLTARIISTQNDFFFAFLPFCYRCWYLSQRFAWGTSHKTLFLRTVLLSMTLLLILLSSGPRGEVLLQAVRGHQKQMHAALVSNVLWGDSDDPCIRASLFSFLQN